MFSIGDKVKFLSSPADVNKSVGLIGTITAVLPTVVNFKTGEVRVAYGTMISPGPNGQQCYGLAAREQDIELITKMEKVNVL